jgi:DNA-binding NarL/FixJ family response regulator
MSHALHILFIDGYPEDRDYYVQRLKTSSPEYVIYEAATGQTGLDLYRFHPIDCVILELELPDMSGFEVLPRVVPVARQPDIPVIILTRSSFRSLMELALLNGAYMCLYKSTSPGDLLDTAILQAISAVRLDRKNRIIPNPLWGLARSA